MQKHVAYWAPYVNDELSFWASNGSQGGYGISVVRVDSDEHLQLLPANGMNSYEDYPMRAVTWQP